VDTLYTKFLAKQSRNLESMCGSSFLPLSKVWLSTVSQFSWHSHLLYKVFVKNSYTSLVTDTSHGEMDEHDLNIRCSVLTSYRMPYNLHEHVRDTVRCLNMLILTLSTLHVPIPHPTACHLLYLFEENSMFS